MAERSAERPDHTETPRREPIALAAWHLDRPPAREAGLSLDDIVAQLRWPRVFRATSLAARPGRLAFCILAIVIFIGIGSALRQLPGLELEAESTGIAAREPIPTSAAVRGDPSPLSPARVAWRLIAPAAPIPAALLMLTALTLWTITGLAVARSTAEEMGLGLRIRTLAAARFALRASPATALGFLLGPALILAVSLPAPLLARALSTASDAGSLAGLAAGVFSVVGVALAFIAMLASVLVAGGAPLIAPAAACDGPDPFDAPQRAFGYLAARPLYALAMAATSLLPLALVGAAAWAAWSAAGAFVRAVATPTDPMREGLARAGLLVVPVVLGYLLSWLHVAGTVIYLTLREEIDGQTPRSLWDPGHAAGVLSGGASADPLKSSLRTTRSRLRGSDTSEDPANDSTETPAAGPSGGPG